MLTKGWHTMKRVYIALKYLFKRLSTAIAWDLTSHNGCTKMLWFKFPLIRERIFEILRSHIALKWFIFIWINQLKSDFEHLKLIWFTFNVTHQLQISNCKLAFCSGFERAINHIFKCIKNDSWNLCADKKFSVLFLFLFFDVKWVNINKKRVAGKVA